MAGTETRRVRDKRADEGRAKVVNKNYWLGSGQVDGKFSSPSLFFSLSFYNQPSTASEQVPVLLHVEKEASKGRGGNHSWELPVLHYNKIMVIFPFPFLVVITQLFS